MIAGIQILRAAAAAMVAVLHIQHDAAGLAARAGLAFTPATGWPWLAGVDIFFVISGFIMVHASRDLFARPGAARLFLARRLARIVPIYWLATSLYLAALLAAPAALNSARPGWGEILASYLFWPVERADGLVQPVYSLGWTLNYEMLFYGLFGAMLVLPMRKAVTATAACLIALVGLGMALPMLGVSLPTAPAFWSRPIVLEFALGMGIGLLRAEGIRLPGVARLGLAGLGLAGLALDLGSETGQTAWRAVVFHGVPAACLVAAAGLGEGRDRPSASSALSGRLRDGAVALGDASYALYLLHPFVSRALRLVVEKAGIVAVLGPWGFVALALAGSVLVAWLVHRGFERPVTRAGRRVLGG